MYCLWCSNRFLVVFQVSAKVSVQVSVPLQERITSRNLSRNLKNYQKPISTYKTKCIIFSVYQEKVPRLGGAKRQGFNGGFREQNLKLIIKKHQFQAFFKNSKQKPQQKPNISPETSLEIRTKTSYFSDVVSGNILGFCLGFCLES